MNPWSTWQSIVGKINYHYLKSNEVLVAKTEEEFRAIQRLVYQVYVEERKYVFPGIDHERRIVVGPDDEAEHSRFFYTKDDKGLVSACLISCWKREDISEGVASDLSLDLLPGLEGLHITEICRLVVREDVRGNPIVAGSVLVRAFEEAVLGLGGDLGFIYCVPGLLPYYLKIGFRPYGGRLVDMNFCSMIPVVIVPSDVAHLKKVGSFLAPAAEKIFGNRPPLDISAFEHLLSDENIPVVIDDAKLLTMLQALEEIHCEFLAGLSAKDLETLASAAFAMDVEPGQVLTSTGTRETEIYLVLEGSFEILANDRVIAVLSDGDVIGEVAFFTAEHQRTATVRAIGACKILVLKRSAIMKLLRNAPETGAQLLFNLARALAGRLVTTTQRFAATGAEISLPPRTSPDGDAS